MRGGMRTRRPAAVIDEQYVGFPLRPCPTDGSGFIGMPAKLTPR